LILGSGAWLNLFWEFINRKLFAVHGATDIAISFKNDIT
jgi:hypothetical protein